MGSCPRGRPLSLSRPGASGGRGGFAANTAPLSLARSLSLSPRSLSFLPCCLYEPFTHTHTHSSPHATRLICGRFGRCRAVYALCARCGCRSEVSVALRTLLPRAQFAHLVVWCGVCVCARAPPHDTYSAAQACGVTHTRTHTHTHTLQALPARIHTAPPARGTRHSSGPAQPCPAQPCAERRGAVAGRSEVTAGAGAGAGPARERVEKALRPSSSSA